jgi:hypothetical protein
LLDALGKLVDAFVEKTNAAASEFCIIECCIAFGTDKAGNGDGLHEIVVKGFPSFSMLGLVVVGADGQRWVRLDANVDVFREATNEPKALR